MQNRVLCFLDSLVIVLSSLKSLLVSLLDVYSDLCIVYAVLISLLKIMELNKILKKEDTNKEANVTARIFNFQNLTAKSMTAKKLIETCNVTDIKEFGEELTILQNMFSKYLTNLLAVFLMTIIKQSVKSIGIAEISWTAHYEGGRSSATQMASRLFGFNFLATPFLIFREMCRTSLRLKDPEQEVASDPNNYDKTISLNRKRYDFLVTESFVESLASCRSQLSYYFAFSYIVGSQDLKSLDCIGQELLGDDKGILTFKVTEWHGMPLLAFSALLSLISITLAQFNVYKTRHEFDMTISGKFFYLASALLASFVKISVHVMYYSMVLIVLIDPKTEGSQLVLLSLPTLVIYYLQTKIVSIVNWWTASSQDSGYSLMTNTAFIWPATTNMLMERNRLRRMRSLSREKKEGKLLESDLDPKEIFKREVYEQNIVQKLFARLHPSITARNQFWFIDMIYPFMAIFVQRRLDFHPEQYSFNGTSDSRRKFRKRFQWALGLNFGLICFQLLIGLVTIMSADIDTRSQLATRNATWFWLSLIPTYVLAMLLLFIFYEKGHAWRKEQVVVGFQFTSNIPFDDTQNSHQQIIAQTNFRGSWVTAMKKETDTDTLEVPNTEINNPNVIQLIKMPKLDPTNSTEDVKLDSQSSLSPPEEQSDDTLESKTQIDGDPQSPINHPEDRSEIEIQVEGASQTSTDLHKEQSDQLSYDMPSKSESEMRTRYLIKFCDFFIFLLHIVSCAILVTIYLFFLSAPIIGSKIFKL